LRAVAGKWDDLWWRSDVTMPTVRAELVAQWVEQFAPQSRFHALVVEDQDQYVAALPLVDHRIAPLVQVGGLPSNEWAPSGSLLLDEQADTHAVLDVLVEAIEELPWPLLWLDAACLQSAAWKALLSALERAGLKFADHLRYRVGWLAVSGDWQQYQNCWSRNHRQQLRKFARRLEKEGALRVRIESTLAAEQVDVHLRRGFEVEDRNWKGRSGTSVLRTPGMYDFLLRQAQQLAQWGQLEIVTLECQEMPMAFEYAWAAKGVYHSFKVGYDEQFAAFSPGQLLRYYLLERFHDEPVRRGIDFLGPLTGAVAKWRPETYDVGRLVIAQRRPFGRALFCAYRHLWPQVRRMLGKPPLMDCSQAAARDSEPFEPLEDQLAESQVS
jgi:hypothetical protein